MVKLYIETDELKKQNARLKRELDCVRKSASYRVGRGLTFLPRKLRGGVKCYQEHGAAYTADRLLVHLRIKKVTNWGGLPMQNNPAVSIVIPVYNAEKYLGECLDSVVNQTLRDIEIICVDDCSADGSRGILEQYAARDGRIRLLVHEQNRGTAQSRKDGVMMARSNYLMFMDNDDVLKLNACAALVEEIKARKVDMLQFGVEIDSEGQASQGTIDFCNRYTRPYLGYLRGEEIFKAYFVKQEFGFYLWGKIYRTELCKKAFAEIEDGFYTLGEDRYASFFLAWYAESSYGIAEKYYRYITGRGLTTFKKSISMDRFLQYCAHYEIAQKYRAFLLRQNKWDEYMEAWEAQNQLFADSCIYVWSSQLSAAEKEAGLRELASRWGLSCILQIARVKHRGRLSQCMRGVSGSDLLIQGGYKADPADAAVPAGFERVVPVVFSCNEAYAPFAGIAIRSVLEHTGAGKYYRVYVLHSDLTDETMQLLESQGSPQLSVHCLDVGPLLLSKKSELYEKSYFTKEMYYRFLIPEIFSFYETVIYLDCDLIVKRDIADILPPDMGDRLLAAVRNIQTEKRRKELAEWFQLEAENYFNSGVLVFNVRQWREEDTEEKCFDTLAATDTKLLSCPDQDILNIVCRGRVLYLDEAWNYYWHMLYGSAEYVALCKALTDRIGESFYVLHFASKQKPWYHPELPLANYFWRYAKNSVFFERIVETMGKTAAEELAKQKAEVARLKHDLDCVHKSVSFRVGRGLTFVPRKLRGGVKCYQEHGAAYTADRLLMHLRLKK